MDRLPLAWALPEGTRYLGSTDSHDYVRLPSGAVYRKPLYSYTGWRFWTMGDLSNEGDPLVARDIDSAPAVL
jgi:hypothetical protein